MSAREDPDDAQVTYTVKELLESIKEEQAAGFMRLETGISTKADKADVVRMEARIEGHAQRLGALEQSQRDEERERSGHDNALRHWFGTGGRIGAAVVGIAVVISGVVAVTGIHI